MSPQLRRSITLVPLVFYGVGTMVGGGFYALLGKVAGLAGMLAPVALLVAGSLACLTALSFAELSSRFPVSAGEVRYVAEGFGSRSLSIVVGWLVITTGVVSAATLAVATVGFLQDLVAVPAIVAILLLVVAMGLVAGWGIGESVGLVFAITVVEVVALIAAVILVHDGVATLPVRWPELVPTLDPRAWVGILSGAFLVFYAFLGFEDMVNVAEEVTESRRNLPIAILVSVVVTTLIYVLVSVAAVLAVAPADLAASNTPLATMVSNQGWYASTGLVTVSLMTGVNGALVQIIMAARIVYGMARRDKAPRWLGRVHPTTQTPLRATALMTGVVALLALYFPLTTLARATSTIILIIFATVNLSLWRVKRRDPDLEGEGPRLPGWLPIVAAGSCVGILLFQAAVVLGVV